jgi:hypothetical protein
MTTNAPAIEQHPDIAGLRHREFANPTLVGQATAGLTVLTGLYVAISPWVVGFSGTANLAASNLVTGLALAVLGLGFAAAADRTRGLTWLAPLVGVWTIIAPWAVEGPAPADSTILSNVIVGAVGVLVGLGTLGSTLRR